MSPFHELRIPGYSRYLLLEIKSGLLTEKRKYDLIDYEVFKDKQFTEFKKTEEYKVLVRAAKKSISDEKELDALIRRIVVYHSTEFLAD